MTTAASVPKISGATRELTAYFLISFLYSWAFWTPAALSHFGAIHVRFSPVNPLQLLGDFGPAVGALAVAALNQGALRQLGLSMLRTRFPLRWYAVSLFIPIAITVSASVARAAALHVKLQITLENIWHPSFVQSRSLAEFVAIVGYAVGMFVFAAAEEIGWRGFALPRLISTMGFLPAALFLGVMWALWHLPLAFTDGNPLQGESFLLFAASTVLGSLLLAWVWVHTGSVLLATLFHAAGNFTFFLLQPTATTGYRTVSTLVFVVLIGCFWRPALFAQAQAGMEGFRSSSSAGDAGP